MESVAFDKAVGKLANSLYHHLDEEERTLLNDALGLDPAVRQSLGDAWVAERDRLIALSCGSRTAVAAVLPDCTPQRRRCVGDQSCRLLPVPAQQGEEHRVGAVPVRPELHRRARRPGRAATTGRNGRASSRSTSTGRAAGRLRDRHLRSRPGAASR